MAEFFMNSLYIQPESLNLLTTITETTHSNATNTTVIEDDHHNVYSGNTVHIALSVFIPILFLHFIVILTAVYLWKKYKKSRVPDPENPEIFVINVRECSQYGCQHDEESVALRVPLMKVRCNKFSETQSSEEDDVDEEVYDLKKLSKENLLKEEEREDKEEKQPFADMICDKNPEYTMKSSHHLRTPYVENNKSDSDSEEKEN